MSSFLLQGKQHVAQVLSGGVIMSKGKSYRTPEFWLESILGNNIPVGSMYALNKVSLHRITEMPPYGFRKLALILETFEFLKSLSEVVFLY